METYRHELRTIKRDCLLRKVVQPLQLHHVRMRHTLKFDVVALEMIDIKAETKFIM